MILRVFTDDDVRRHLDPVAVIAALEAAFSSGQHTSIPPRTHVPVADMGVLLLMPSFDASGIGVKLVTVFPNAAERLQATYILLDARTGKLRAVLEANYLTDLRTAAVSAIATKYMSRNDATTLGVFGTGRLSRAHARVLPAVRHFERILVCGSSSARSADFAAELQRVDDVDVAPADPRTCVQESDVICTCTTATMPLFEGKWLRPGTHLNLVGAFQPHAREVDTETIVSGRVAVDTYAGALAEAGDLLIPLQENAITRDHIVADLHQLVTRKVPGRTSPDEITIFKSVGCALEDLVTADLLWSKVQEKTSP